MTPDDDRLAPVTSLAGRRAAQKAALADDDSVADATGAGAADGADNAVGSGAGTAGWADSDLPVTPRLTALPTYAEFAAKTEPELRAGGVSRGVAGSPFTNASESAHSEPNVPEFEAEPEPEIESDEAARHRAENISLQALSRRGVSSVEMAKTLRSRDLPEEVVLHEIERLERVGLLDDAELAENLVRSKQERKGLGKSAINAELRQRGIDQEAIEAALADIDDDDEQSRADEWAAKRAGQLRGLDQQTAERRLSAFLMRRGYRSEVARRAIEKALPRGGSSRGGVRFQ